MNREHRKVSRAAAPLAAALAVCALLFVLALAPSAARAGDGPASLGSEGSWAEYSLEPESVVVEPGDIFTATVRLQTGQYKIDVTQAFVDFNPKVLQAVTMWPGNTLPGICTPMLVPPLPPIDNELGQVNHCAYAPLGQPEGESGTFEVMTIQFRAVRNSVGTSIEFSQEAGRVTKAIELSYPRPLKTLGATVVVSELVKVTLPLLLRLS